MFEEILKYAESFGDKISVVIEDLKSGEQIRVNSNKRFSAASVIKYPIMWCYMHEVEAGAQSLEEVYPLRREDKAGTTVHDSGVLRELHDGIPLTMEDYLKFMIVISDDTATNVIIRKLGMEHINQLMQEKLQYQSTELGRVMMDYEALERGQDNFITAEEMNRLSEHICRGELLSEESNARMLKILCGQRYNNTISRDYPLDAVFGHKSGSIDQYEMEHDCGILMKDGEPVATINVLTQSLDEAPSVMARIGMMVYNTYFQ